MTIELLQATAAVYLIAGLVAGLGLALPAPRLERAAVLLLAVGAGVHGLSFAFLHRAEPTPPLTELPAAVSFMAWVGTASFLVLLLRARLTGLSVLVAPAAFLGVFFAALRLPSSGPASIGGSGSWPHAHVLLASAGISLLGLAGLAGLLFLAEHRRLKGKRALKPALPLPSLEALDRVNRAALALGFSLLTLGVITGMFWVQAESGRIWTGTPHEIWSLGAWIVYAALVISRFGAGQGSRQAAASAVGAFAFLFFAVIGVGLLV